MATLAVKQRKPRVFGPRSNGILMTPEEFDRARFAEGWRYELINGVLIVSLTPSRSERDPNGELEYLLRVYRDTHPQGKNLDATFSEETVETGKNRRIADRVIWAGLGRLPGKKTTPTIIVEFVSPGKRNRERDYETKRKEYLKVGVKEYWIIDRFERTLTVFARQAGKLKKRTVRETQVYRPELLPGFELPLARLLAVADQWAESEEDE